MVPRQELVDFDAGCPAATASSVALRYLPQNIELFAGPVRENIARLGGASDEAVVAAKLADAHRTVLGLDTGYETHIGEGGVPVSGGQRQRIAFAHAVFGDPALVVLDEPNAHLDGDGEWALWCMPLTSCASAASRWCWSRNAPPSW